MNYKELVEKVESLRKELREAEQLLSTTSDGYTYKAVSLRYGHTRKHEFMNAIAFDEFIENSGEGENYIIKESETNNPAYKINEEKEFSVNGVEYEAYRYYITGLHNVSCCIYKKDSYELEFRCIGKTIDESIKEFMDYLI